ncbi:MAG: lytic transglycosylase domain-containing protein [Pyrinomonadaceae bacterium]
MKRFPFAAALTLLSALPLFAQGPANYRVDNFDMANAVRVEIPVAVTPQPRKRLRKLTASNNLAYSHSKGPLTQLTSMNASNSLEGFTTGNAEVDGFIVESGKRNSVDPLLLYAIMHQESTFKQRAISPKGARGLMQLMPPTARRFGVTNIFDPRQNIEGGTRYVRFLLDYFEGNVELALAGYNAGEGAVIKYGYRVPPYAETQEYVRRISRRYSLIRDPLAASLANRLTPDQLAAAQKDSKPLSSYERTVSAVRLPDGRLQLLSQ